MNSSHHIVVWIDHKEARIFNVDAKSIDEKTVSAPTHHIHRHPKGGTEGHNHPDDAHHFFKEVAHTLAGTARVLIVGPGVAKLQFIRYAAKHDDKTLEARIVGVETVDHPTDGQLIAFAKHYFVADDHMQGHPSTIEERK